MYMFTILQYLLQVENFKNIFFYAREKMLYNFYIIIKSFVVSFQKFECIFQINNLFSFTYVNSFQLYVYRVFQNYVS